MAGLMPANRRAPMNIRTAVRGHIQDAGVGRCLRRKVDSEAWQSVMFIRVYTGMVPEMSLDPIAALPTAFVAVTTHS